MVELGIPAPEQIFVGVSSPAILEVLEPLEVITAEKIQSDISLTPWPPLRLLKAWYWYQGDEAKARKLEPALPAHPGLYIASRDHGSDLPSEVSHRLTLNKRTYVTEICADEIKAIYEVESALPSSGSIGAAWYTHL
jgi:hypothetical protein